MTTAIQKQNVSGEIVASIVLKGDISGLSQTQKVEYYQSVCERVGLDPATQPFQLLRLNGKEVLYCSKAGAEQLTKVHKISHEIKERQTVSEVHIVYVRASLPDGRFNDSSGAVSIAGLRGDGLANAFMKAETKAKRRATLSILGLGMLDETEIETIPGATPEAVVPIPVKPEEVKKVEPAPETVKEARVAEILDAVPVEDRKHKLVNEEVKCPVGNKIRGKMLKDCPREMLLKAIDHCKTEGIHLDFVEKAEAYLADTGLPI